MKFYRVSMQLIQFKDTSYVFFFFFSGAFCVYGEFTHKDSYENATIFLVGVGVGVLQRKSTL